MRDVLLTKPGNVRESHIMVIPLHEPPFLTPSAPATMEIPKDQRTSVDVSYFLKNIYRHAVQRGKKP